MRRILFFAWVTMMPLMLSVHAQTATDPNEGMQMTADASTGAQVLSWWSRTGRTYFVQQSFDLVNWTYVPVVRDGASPAAPDGLNFTCSDPRQFWRLKYTDASTGGLTGAAADFDGDKVSNLAEAQNNTNPFSSVDTDGDQIPDDWEIDAGGNPNDPYDALLDSDGDRIPNRYEFAHGTDGGDASSHITPALSVDAVSGVDSSGSTNKKTIGAAISAASTAYTVIRVKPGSYSAVISTNKTVMLLADVGGQVVLSYNGQLTGVSIQGRDMVLRDFQLVSAGWSQDRAPVEIILSDPSYQAAMINCSMQSQGVCKVAPLRIDKGTAVVIHCTIAGNFTGAGTNNAGSISLYSSANPASSQRLVLRNSILWNPESHMSNEIYAASGSTVVATGNLMRDGAYSSLSGDPGLDRYGMLKSGSPAILGGSATSYLVSQDIHGESRTGLADIGADEYKDTDADNLPDWWEQNYFANLTSASGASDNDSPTHDGLLNRYEYLLGFNPLNPDTSGDPALPDYLAALLMSGDAQYPPEWLVDADGDGLDAGWEAYYGSSDSNPDSNGDGISDLAAFLAGYNPTLADIDGDSLNGAAELALGTSALSADTDGDGVNDNLDAFPLDPFISTLPAANPMDMTAPLVTLTKPAEAVLVP